MSENDGDETEVDAVLSLAPRRADAQRYGRHATRSPGATLQWRETVFLGLVGTRYRSPFRPSAMLGRVRKTRDEGSGFRDRRRGVTALVAR